MLYFFLFNFIYYILETLSPFKNIRLKWLDFAVRPISAFSECLCIYYVLNLVVMHLWVFDNESSLHVHPIHPCVDDVYVDKLHISVFNSLVNK